jgi:pimeloyl-ACP methyl ester carboxylesterase
MSIVISEVERIAMQVYGTTLKLYSKLISSLPVLILRGTQDSLVDNETCKRYLELYHDKKKYVQIDGGNHNFASITAREGCETAIIQYVQDILK